MIAPYLLTYFEQRLQKQGLILVRKEQSRVTEQRLSPGVLWNRLSGARDAGDRAEDDLQEVTKMNQAQASAMEKLQEEMKVKTETNARLLAWKRDKGKRLKELDERMKYLNKIGTLDTDKLANDNKKLEAQVKSLNKELAALKSGENVQAENLKLKREVADLRKKLAREKQVKQMVIDNFNNMRKGNQSIDDEQWDDIFTSQMSHKFKASGMKPSFFGDGSMMSSRGMMQDEENNSVHCAAAGAGAPPPKFTLVTGERVPRTPINSGVISATPRGVRVTLDAQINEDEVLQTSFRKMQHIDSASEVAHAGQPRRQPSIYDSRHPMASRTSRVQTAMEFDQRNTTVFPAVPSPHSGRMSTKMMSSPMTPTVPEPKKYKKNESPDIAPWRGRQALVSRD